MRLFRVMRGIESAVISAGVLCAALFDERRLGMGGACRCWGWALLKLPKRAWTSGRFDTILAHSIFVQYALVVVCSNGQPFVAAYRPHSTHASQSGEQKQRHCYTVGCIAYCTHQ